MLEEARVGLRRVQLGLDALGCLVEAHQPFFPAAVFLALGQAAPTAHHLGPRFVQPLLLQLLVLTAVLLELLLDLRLQVLHVDLRGRLPLLASLKWLGVEVLMDGVYFCVVVIYFEVLVAERVDPSADEAHLVLVEAEVLDAVGVLHDLLHLERQLLQGEMAVLADVDF